MNGATKLYSVYHAPRINDNKKIGLIMCYPIGQEYIRCHKLFVNFANKSGATGFHVLRFDYSGTGDSTGEFDSFSIEQGLIDIKLAIRELIEATGITEIILIGVRFGATLALLCSQNVKVRALILWNPILNGKRYIKELNDTYAEWLAGSFTKEEKISSQTISSFGFTYPTKFVNQLESLSITKKDFPGNVPILLIDNNIESDLRELSTINFCENINRNYWVKREDEYKSLIPIHELSLTIDWLKKIYND